MELELTGELLFFRYAFPCATHRAANRLISREDYHELERCAHNRHLPARELLERCFPNAVSGLCKTTFETNCEPWSLENVRFYWRYRHDGSTHSSTLRGTVLRTDGRHLLVTVADRKIPVENPYLLPVTVGAEAMIHNHCVAEIL